MVSSIASAPVFLEPANVADFPAREIHTGNLRKSLLGFGQMGVQIQRMIPRITQRGGKCIRRSKR